MPITLDHETETVLRSQARARGLSVDEYLRVLVSQSGVPGISLVSPGEAVQAWEEFCTPIDGLAVRPGETFSREMIYDDHD